MSDTFTNLNEKYKTKNKDILKKIDVYKKIRCWSVDRLNLSHIEHLKYKNNIKNLGPKQDKF